MTSTRPARRGACRGLSGLLGATRAAVLQAVARGDCSTTQLARRTGISVASASEHATVLRDAGLVRTERAGRAVRHTLTELGGRLLGQQDEVPVDRLPPCIPPS